MLQGSELKTFVCFFVFLGSSIFYCVKRYLICLNVYDFSHHVEERLAQISALTSHKIYQAHDLILVLY